MTVVTCAHCRRAETEPDCASLDPGCNGCFEREMARGPLWFECVVWKRRLRPYLDKLAARYREPEQVEAAHERIKALYLAIVKARRSAHEPLLEAA